MLRLLQSLFILPLFTTVSASYEDAYKLERFLFTNYSTRIRPVHDFNQPIEVTSSFRILTMVSVEELHGQVSLLGVLNLSWIDEKLQWDPSEYGGIMYLNPYPEDVWRPRLHLLNSLDDLDPFEDKYDFLSLTHTGRVTWLPTGLFAALCNLDLTKFPFDKHVCTLVFRPIFTINHNIVFTTAANLRMLQGTLDTNGEWVLKQATLSTIKDNNGTLGPTWIILVTMVMERRPEYFLMNFLIPVMLLSVLNLLSFTLVVNDGSVNISYSMTVLLAYTIYMSILIDHLPSVSMNMPFLSYYLFFLFILSLLTTVDIIFIVWLNNKEEEVDKKQKMESVLQGVMNKLVNLKRFRVGRIASPEHSSGRSGKDSNPRPVSKPVNSSSFPDDPLETDAVLQANSHNTTNPMKDSGGCVMDKPPRVNRYKNMGETIRIYSLYVFVIINIVAACLTCVVLSS